VPEPLAPPIISGVNVSSDATYWSAVSNNQGYSYTCTDGSGVYIARGDGNNPTFNNLSK
jgi:purine nucleoside permease